MGILTIGGVIRSVTSPKTGSHETHVTCVLLNSRRASGNSPLTELGFRLNPTSPLEDASMPVKVDFSCITRKLSTEYLFANHGRAID